MCQAPSRTLFGASAKMNRRLREVCSAPPRTSSRGLPEPVRVDDAPEERSRTARSQKTRNRVLKNREFGFPKRVSPEKKWRQPRKVIARADLGKLFRPFSNLVRRTWQLRHPAWKNPEAKFGNATAPELHHHLGEPKHAKK